MYPRLEDHDLVRAYPHVSGMQMDVLFFTHTNKENGADDSVSKYNDFEVRIPVHLKPDNTQWILGRDDT